MADFSWKLIPSIEDTVRDATDATFLAPCWKGRRAFPSMTTRLDRRVGGVLRDLVRGGAFDPVRGTFQAVPLPGGGQVVLVGMGPVSDFEEDTVRIAVGRAARAACAGRNRVLAVDLLSLLPTPKAMDCCEAAAYVAEAARLARYRFGELRKDEGPPARDPRRGILAVPADETAAARRGVREGEAVAAGACLARTLVNRPANLATPTAMAAAARSVGRRHRETMKVAVLGPAALDRLGMGALRSVAQGSREPARFIVADYRPRRRSRGTIVLVGKTVTFDSGGLSLKPGKGMQTMKGDMGGGAAVLGALDALASVGAAVRVAAILPAVENMPSGHATRPGDVVTSLAGLTVEVLNTDAEGRMTLADGLAYAKRFKPDAIVDIATLTGACMVALGPHRAGLFTGDDGLRDGLLEAGRCVGEKVWPMPMDREYDDLVRSDVADLKNISGGGEGGSIVAAVFLRRFVPDGVPWAHLDIAGREFAGEDKPYTPKGATGFGARLLTRFVRDWADARATA